MSLAFLSGNSVDGEIVLAASSDGRADRTFERFTGRGDDDDMADEETLMGSTSYGVGLGDWIVTRPDHWLFAGTGVKAGDRIAGLVGWEHHGPPLRDDPTLKSSPPGRSTTSRGNRQPDTHGAVVYAGGNGNIVFNAGTCWWNMVLVDAAGLRHAAQQGLRPAGSARPADHAHPRWRAMIGGPPAGTRWSCDELVVAAVARRQLGAAIASAPSAGSAAAGGSAGSWRSSACC